MKKTTFQKYTIAPELTKAYVKKVWDTLSQHIRPTVLLSSPALSQQFGCDLTIATETFQYTGSFKFRAAYNLISSIPEKFIIAASSGNFGQGVAYACQLLHKKCIIVMPKNSAQVKIDAVKFYGATVDLVEGTMREKRVRQLLEKYKNGFEAKPYDDYRVITGNSTLGKEILNASDFDYIIVPVGGGGLSSGIIISRNFLNKKTKIIGAEPQLGNDAACSFRSGTLIFNKKIPNTIADGAKTNLGKLNWEILRTGIEGILEVSDNTIIKAMQIYFRYGNLKVEPTGALSLGALLKNTKKFQGKKVCCIVSGGNVDPAMYSSAIVQDTK